MKAEDKLAILRMAGFKTRKLRFANGVTEYWFINPQGKKPSERIVCRNPDKRQCIHRAFERLIQDK